MKPIRNLAKHFRQLARPAATSPLYGVHDVTRRTWTDSTGHVMDLSLTWRDCEGQDWVFADEIDSANGPVMRSAARGLTEPLDLVMAVWGPVKPVGGADRG